MNIKTEARASNPVAAVFFCMTIAAFAAILVIPFTRTWFEDASKTAPYLMAFFKFGFLATSGELLAMRLSKGAWGFPELTPARAVIWAVFGIAITFMMRFYSQGIAAMLASNMLPFENSALAKAFFISFFMNFTFGILFMALHKVSDYLIDNGGQNKLGFFDAVKLIDWSAFCRITVCKIIPLFWVPAHTVTFLLPSEYQVVMAAALSIALGVLLNMKKR